MILCIDLHYLFFHNSISCLCGKNKKNKIKKKLKIKRRQYREGIFLVPLPLIPDSELCPITAIRYYFSLVPAPSRYPFFCVPHERRLSPLTSYTFLNTFKKLVSVLELDPRNYSPHSFRHGGATLRFPDRSPGPPYPNS